MAVLALGVAGAAIGGALVPGVVAFGLTGASIGWMAGTALGSLIGPGQNFQGPRVGDKTVTSSTLGTDMAVLYGTCRIGGNVIQCSDIREVSNTQSVGKGGPKATSTTYMYNVDIAVDLCAGVAKGIRKIWMDSKLVYDVSTNVSAGSVVASSVHAQNFAFYPGDENQMPDPTLEALLGAGNVPAYRGRCYVVFSQLDCPNGRIPQLTFEVVMASGAASNPNQSYATAPAPSLGSLASIGEKSSFQFESNTSYNVAKHPMYVIGLGYAQYKAAPSIAQPGQVNDDGTIPVQSSAAPRALSRSRFNPPAGYYLTEQFIEWDAANLGGNLVISHNMVSSTDGIGYAWAAYDDITKLYATVGQPSEVPGPGAHITITPSLVRTGGIPTAGTPVAFYNGVVYNCGLSGGVMSLYEYSGTDGSLQNTIAYTLPGALRTTDHLLICANAYGVFVLEGEPDPYAVNRQCWQVTSSGWTLLSNTVNFENGNGEVRTFFCNGDYLIVGGCTGTAGQIGYYVIGLTAIAPSMANVKDVILAECERAGLQASQVDVSAITDTLWGYPVTRVAPARNTIEPLCTAFYIDAQDVDGKLVFHKRASQPTVATIPFTDLAAVDGGGVPGDPFPLVRTQELDMPRSITVQFIDQGNDYQPGAEQSVRQITSSINETQQSVPIVMQGSQAHQIADVLMHDTWSARNARTGQLTRNYAYLVPGDVVNLEYPQGTYGTWLLTGVHDTGVVIQFTAVEANSSLYTSAATGTDTGASQTTDPLISPPNLTLLDVPLLRDQDDYPGMYIALGAHSSSFQGGALTVGTNYSAMAAEGSTTSSAPTGITENALGNWTKGVIDETNTLTVNVGVDVLSSTTRSNVVQGTANYCAVGAPGRWEILQFIRAVSLGNGRYTLSGLKRGLRGTGQNTGNHAVGDTFVLITQAGMLKPRFPLTDVGIVKHWEAVSVGDSTNTHVEVDGADTGVCLKPFSPFNVRTKTNSDGTITITWNRRTRYAENWLAGNVPLGETAEQYSIDITPNGGATTTLTSSTTSVTTALGSWAKENINSGFNAARCAFSLGGYLFAMQYNPGTNAQVYKLDPATLKPVGNPGAIGENCSKMLTDGTYIYTICPGGSALGYIRKWDQNLNLLASVQNAYIGEPYGAVWCAGSLWLTLTSANRISAGGQYTLARWSAALASQATITGVQAYSLTTDGTYVYACGTNTVWVIDPSSNSIKSSFSVSQSNIKDCAFANGLLWTVSVADGNCKAWNPSSGALVYTIPMTKEMWSSYWNYISSAGNVLCIGQQPQLQFVDATSGSIIGTIEGLSGGSGGTFLCPNATLLTANKVLVAQGPSTAEVLDYYDRLGIGGGTTISVYQVSSSVGRGFPATITR